MSVVLCKWGCGRGVDPVAYPHVVDNDGTYSCGCGPRFTREDVWLLRHEVDAVDSDYFYKLLALADRIEAVVNADPATPSARPIGQDE